MRSCISCTCNHIFSETDIEFDHNNSKTLTQTTEPLYEFKKGTTLIHLNVRSLLPKHEELKFYLTNKKIQVFSVNETWLDSSIADNEIAIPGFNIFRRDRPKGSHGGVALYVRSELQPFLMVNLFDEIVESVFVKIKLGSRSILVGSIYRPPSALSSYWDSMKLLLEKVTNLNLKTIILGDLNLDLNDSHKCSLISELELLFQFKQLISDYTRVTTTSSTILDLIFTTTLENHVDSGVIPLGLSDHFAIYTTLSFKQHYRLNSHRVKRSRNYKNFNKKLYLDDLNNSSVFKQIFLCDDINIAWQTWKNEFLRICNKHAPVRFCKIKSVNNPWITADILKLINHRDFLLKKALTSKLEADFRQYQNARNRVNIAIRKVKKSFYSEKIIAASSQNELWKTLRNVLPSKRDQSCNPNLSAEVFNSYFSSIGKNVTKDISFNKHFDLSSVSNRIFQFSTIPTSFIVQCLSNLKSNSSIDIIDMDVKLLIIASSIIAPSLAHVFNLSLSSGIVPSDLKLARVTPLYKGKGDLSEMGNYRPISVIPHLGKILEKSVKYQLMAYLTEHRLITDYQMAYMKGRSTQTMNYISNKFLSNINNGLYTCACLIDLSKWPTVLGPILFLIFINDLPSILPNDSCLMYADDITLYCSSSSLQDATLRLQAIVNKTAEWINSNRLIINTSKSHSIIIGSKKKTINSQLELFINGVKIEQISHGKLLGIHIDNQLNWENQCVQVCKTISKKFGLLKRLRKGLPLSTISLLYFPFIQSHIDYCLTAWGNCPSTYLSHIQSLQNKIIRFLTNKYDYIQYPSSLLRKHLGVMSVSERYKYFMSVLMYKCIKMSDENILLKDCFTFANSLHNYPTRRGLNGDLNLPRPYLEQFKRSIAYSGVKIWNSIDINIRQCDSLQSFKIFLRDTSK